ncbi:MAG TPA: DbpA RNA binding domain-containing protein [Gemmatimonadales bacterium]|nr:DbpA RNA binding domain-containing protein [Gemmatimonadales bacterium]
MSTLDEGRAALARGRPVIVVMPPDPAQAGVLWSLLGLPHGDGTQATIVVCTDASSAAEWIGVVPGIRAYAVDSVSRALQRLRNRPVDLVSGSADDLLALTAQSALKWDAVGTIVLAWPEQLVAAGRSEALEALLGDARTARRVVLSWNPSSLKEFLARHAYRAEVLGPAPASDAEPLPAVGPAAFAVTATANRPAAARAAVDALDLDHPMIWDGGPIEQPDAPPDGVLCLRLPTRDEFAALSLLGKPVLFPTAGQLGYARSIAAPLTPLRVSPAPDQSKDRAAALRVQIAARIDAGTSDAGLLLLGPLFDRYDPAEVAAALLGLLETPARQQVPEHEAHATPAWCRLFVKIGTKDGARAKDLVGALTREVGLATTEIGRIDLHDSFAVVDVAADAGARALRGLNRVTIRGRRVEAREDRAEETKRPRRGALPTKR